MEIFEMKTKTDETLSGVSSISRPNDDPTVGDDLGMVVLTKKVVEKTEISVVKMIQDDKEDEFMKNQEHGEANEVMENEKEGAFGNLVDDDGDDVMNVNCNVNGISHAMDVEGSLAGENRTKIFDDEKVENREDNGSKLAENEEFVGEQGGNEVEDHNFVVGDFVWGKISSHPWWPGRIYNPSDASDDAARLKRKGRLLVAYFGDESFSWCSPSQLKPFVDHFSEMSSQNDSTKFVNAVKLALEEASRLVEVGLMCKCQTVNRIDNAGVVNRGIKEGVPVPKGNTIKVLMDRIEPVELVLNLKASATMDPGTRLAELELALLKSCLKVFYGKKGGCLLVEYHDPKCIEGLEDKTRSEVVADSDINGPTESIDNGDDKLYQSRKQKSVAELLREDEPKIKKMKTSKDGGSGKRKRKALVVLVTPESDHESGGGGVEEDTMSPRQRKKSKYLSPPYLSPIGSGKLSVLSSGPGSGSFKEPKPEPEKIPEMTAKLLEDSLKKSSGKKTRQMKGASEGSYPQEEQTKTIDTAVNVNKVLHGLFRVALDPTSFVEKNLPAVTDFVTSYRSSIFKEGSSFRTDRKKNVGDTLDPPYIKQKSVPGQKKRGGHTSDLGFIKQKLESMLETVQACEESEMSADLKASLEGGIQEVLQKVGKMKGK